MISGEKIAWMVLTLITKIPYVMNYLSSNDGFTTFTSNTSVVYFSYKKTCPENTLVHSLN